MPTATTLADLNSQLAIAINELSVANDYVAQADKNERDAYNKWNSYCGSSGADVATCEMYRVLLEQSKSTLSGYQNAADLKQKNVNNIQEAIKQNPETIAAVAGAQAGAAGKATTNTVRTIVIGLIALAVIAGSIWAYIKYGKKKGGSSGVSK